MSDLHGKLLIAPPKLPDWRFQKSVIYMWKHNVAGAGGVIINNNVRIKSSGLNSDIHASSEYRARLITVLAKKAVANS